jgi:hypothetical protein
LVPLSVQSVVQVGQLILHRIALFNDRGLAFLEVKNLLQAENGQRQREEPPSIARSQSPGAEGQGK